MKKLKKDYSIDMCNGPIFTKMLRFTLPLMASGVLQLLFNTADIVVVGQYAGDNSLAAVGSNGALINLLTNLFLGLSIGANVLVARYYGANDDEQTAESVHTAMLISFISGIFLTVLGFIAAEQILTWMQTPPEILGLAAEYLRIYFLGMTSMMVYNFGSAVLRAIGDTRRPLYYLFAAGVINVLLNLLFVVVFHMDVAGVALATIISQTVSAVLILRCMMHESGPLKLEFKKLRLDPQKLGMIIRIGLPAGMQGVIFSISNVIIQAAVNGFGSIIVSAGTVATNIENYVYIIMNSFYQSTLSFTGQNMGAKKYSRINRILLIGLACVAVAGAASGLLSCIFAGELLSIFTSSQQVIVAGIERLWVICSLYLICGCMEIFVGSMRGMGYSVVPMVTSVVGACALRILWIATFFQIPEFHTPFILYLSYPVTWTITLLGHICCYIWIKKKKIPPIDGEDIGETSFEHIAGK